MHAMSVIEAAFCRSLPWRLFAARVALPWALGASPLGERILEVGSGSGAMAAALLSRRREVYLVATDVDPAMVRRLVPRLARYGPRVRVEQADVGGLRFVDGSFDAVMSFLMLHHVVRWEPAMAEVRRVLRPGGRLCGYDLLDGHLSRLIHRLDRSSHRLLSAAELRAGLAAAGFVDVEVVEGLRGLVARFDARVA